MSSSTSSTVIKKKSFLSKNLEHLKAGVAVGFSLSGICVLVAGIVLHIINPAMGFLTIPLALQALLVAAIKKSPKTIELLKSTVRDILKNEDATTVNNFVDEVVSQFSQNTARTNEPIENAPTTDLMSDMPVPVVPVVQSSTRSILAPVNNKDKIPMNAYYYPSEDRYEVTPRK